METSVVHNESIIKLLIASDQIVLQTFGLSLWIYEESIYIVKLTLNHKERVKIQ